MVKGTKLPPKDPAKNENLLFFQHKAENKYQI